MQSTPSIFCSVLEEEVNPQARPEYAGGHKVICSTLNPLGLGQPDEPCGLL